MRIRDEYLHGSDLTGVVKKIEVTTGTGNNANESVIKYTKADSTDSIVEVPIGDITGKAATASKLDNTSAIGSKTNPVYFTEKGIPSACAYSLNATVPVGAANQVLYYSAPNTLDVQSYATLTSNLDVFTVATSSAAGKKGLVPAPAANQLGTRNFFLRADGVWTVIESKSAVLNGTATSLVTTGEKYNWNSAYNWYNSMTSGDTDGIINKWKEVEAFLANYGDSSTLAAELAKLVTLSTDQTITGVKTFSEVINGSITGNAGTANKLKNTVTINGVAFDGSADITITANPNSHSHGNITNEGAIGSAANKPIITTTNGVLTTGAFGTTANTFCEGNDSRLSDARKNPNALTLGVLNNSGAVVGTNTVYDGSSALSFKVKAGSGIILSQNTKGEVVITNAAPDVDHNTDTKVKLTATDGTATDRYIPFPGTSISSGSAYELFYQSDFKYNPGTKLFSVPNIAVGEKITVTGTSALGTVTSGVWNGTPIANDYLAHKSVTINGSIVNLGESIIVTAVANGGNAGTVGGYSPSDFLLKDEYETFESIIVSALTDLDNRKIEASDIPTSLPANGGHASTASNVDWSGVTNKPTSFPANGGNADTVGGYFPSAFVLNTKYEEFKSVVATALTDLNDRKIEVSDIPTSLPASDVYAWAKAENKPTYSWSEITSKPTTIEGYGITNALTTKSIIFKKNYQHYVILLCKIGASTTFIDHTINGILWTTYAGGTRYLAAYINIHCADWESSHNEYYGFTPFGLGTKCRLVTCNYESNTYLAVTFENFLACQIYFDGSYSNILFTPILYYTSNPETINNLEIYNSISEVTSYNKLAFTTDNVASATKLQTARTIWGQSFDGTGNVSGTLTEVGSIIPLTDKSYGIGQKGNEFDSGDIHVLYSRHLESSRTFTNDKDLYIQYKQKGNTLMLVNGGNVGVGTINPSSKLHVAGDIYTTTGFKKEGSDDSYVLLGGGGHKAISDFATSGHTHSYLPLAGGTLNNDSMHSTLSLNATNGSADAWNKEGNTMLKFVSNNNAMVFSIGSPSNERTGFIQVGHADTNNYADVTSALHLNKLGGIVYINNNIAWHAGNLINVSQLTNDAGYLTSHAYSYGSIDIYDVNGAKKTSNNTVFATVNTETLRLQEGANIAITAINSGTSGGDSIKIAVTGITSNIDRSGYGKLSLWHNGASSESAILQSATYNEKLTVKAGSGIDFSETDSTANNDIWTISAIPYNCAITLNANSTKALIKDSWSADALSIYLTSNGTSSGTSLAAGTYALWIEDRSSASGTPNYYSGTFTCAGSATAGRLDEIALHSSMATSADTNAPTRIFVATQISGTSGKHVLRFCSLDSSATSHYLTVKVNRII